MKKKLCVFSVLVGVGIFSFGGTASLRAQTPASANGDILKMIQAGLPETAVVSKIREGAGHWDTSVDALIVLKKAGATDAEINALTAAPAASSPAAAPPPAVIASAPPPDPAVAVLGGSVTNHDGTVVFDVPSSRDPGSIDLRFQVVLVDAHVALKLPTEAIGPKGIYTYGDLVFDHGSVVYNPSINAGAYFSNPFPRWASMSADQPIDFPPAGISPLYEKSDGDIVSEDFRYVEGKGFIYTQYWRPTRLAKKSPWKFKLGEAYAQSMGSIPARDTLDAIIKNFDATVAQVLRAAGVTDPVSQLSASSHYRRPSSDELAPVISKGNAELAERQRVFELLGKNAFVHPKSDGSSGISLFALVNAVQGVANMQQAMQDAKTADLAHDTAGQLRAAVNATTAEMQTLGAVSGDTTTIQPLAPAQLAPAAVAVPQQQAAPAKSVFHVALPPPGQPKAGGSFGPSTGTAKPADCVDVGVNQPCVPLAQWNQMQAQKAASANSQICPPSGFVPGVMRQVASDVAEGIQCIPGQPISTSSTNGGVDGVSSGTPSGSGGGSGNPSGSDSHPGARYVPPISPTCISQDFRANYGWDLYYNNCGVAVHLTVVFPDGEDFGFDPLVPGQPQGTGNGADRYQQIGQPTLYVCPVGSNAVDANGNSFSKPLTQYRCMKLSSTP